jgi:F420-dependent oxidoreductase-like protein
MKMGLQIWPCYPSKYGNHFDTLLALVQACEQAGLDSVWMPDHFMFEQEPVMESFVVLGAIAAATRRIRMGQLVTGMPYRNPALLAKMCATLDVISHGRSIAGLGAAWHEPEFTAYGWSFPAVSERMKRLEEGVQIVDLMLRQSPATFAGKYYSIQDAYNEPQPVQKPRPPILIGGSGERVTLRLVAQYADFCNVFGDPAGVEHKYDVLRKHCHSVGRPFDEITLSNNLGILIAQDEANLAAKQKQYPDFGGIQGTPDVVLSRLKEYAAVGSAYITFHIPKADDIAAIQLIGESVLPHLANL